MRGAVQQITCASNLRQIVTASLTYALDYKGGLPERWRNEASPEGPNFNGWGDIGSLGTQTWAWYNSYNYDNHAAQHITTANIGRLVSLGYLSGGWVVDGANTNVPWLWCPSTQSGATASPANAVSSYFYNPHLRAGPNGSATRFTKLSAFPRNRALVIDSIWWPDSITHTNNSGSAGWNMGFTDGHVEFVESRELYQYIQSNWGTNGYNQVWEACAAIDFLETKADGLNPFKQSIMVQSANYDFANNYGIRSFGNNRIPYGTNELPDTLP